MIVFFVIIATAISTALGGLFAMRIKDKSHLILGFSAGAVLGVALFGLIPESILLTAGTYDVQLVTLLVAAGFSSYMILDRYFSLHGHGEDNCDNKSHSGDLAASALVLHSFLDGFGIGLAFKVSTTIGIVVAISVLVHDFSDGINIVSMITKNKGNRKSAIRWLTAGALAPVVGVIVSNFLTVSEPILGLILSVFAGLFLYLSASELVPESHHRHPEIWTTISTILGMATILIAVSLAK